jgi:hypothetical protein
MGLRAKLPPPYDLPWLRNHFWDLRVDAAHQASQISPRGDASQTHRRSDPFGLLTRTFAPVRSREDRKRYSDRFMPLDQSAS